jgi:hypothetical protein
VVDCVVSKLIFLFNYFQTSRGVESGVVDCKRLSCDSWNHSFDLSGSLKTTFYLARRGNLLWWIVLFSS